MKVHEKKRFIRNGKSINGPGVPAVERNAKNTHVENLLSV